MRITLRRKCDDVVAALGSGDWMIVRNSLIPERARPRSSVPTYRSTAPRDCARFNRLPFRNRA